MGEKLDIFDVNFNHIGVEDREVAHQNGLWHQTFHCWIVNPKNQTVIVQLRGANVKNYPNKLHISSAGHLSAGETVMDGVREVEEEIGLKLKEANLINLGTYLNVKDQINDGKPYIDREFARTYFIKDETPLNQYIMQPEEIDGIYEIKIEDGLKLFSDEQKEISIKGISRLTNSEEIINVKFEDFVNNGKNYYLKVFIMAERLIEGKKYLAI